MKKRKFTSSIYIALCLVFFCIFTLNACKVTENPILPNEPTADTDIVLAENSSTDYSIVIPAEADECEKYASEELALFFKNATEANIPIVTDSGRSFNEADKVISLGETTIKNESGLAVTEDELNIDGFKIQRYGNTVIIDGVSTQGTLYGVYEFLSQEFEFEPYTADVIHINKTTEKVFLKNFNFADEPDFIVRDADGNTISNGVFAGRMRVTVNKTNDDKFGNASPFKKAFGGIIYDNAINTVLPPETYKVLHPDWYEYTGGQICLTYEDRVGISTEDENSVVHNYVERMKEMILENYELGYNGYIVSFVENDNVAYCRCPTCQSKKAEAGGRQSALFILFANRCIDLLEEWKETQPQIADREFEYAVFAYHDTIYAPVDVDENGGYKLTVDWAKPHEKMVIYFCPINSCHYHSYFDQSCRMNSLFGPEWEKWHAICDKFYIYDYVTCYNNYLPFFDNFNVRQYNLQTYYEGGVSVLVSQGTTGQNFSSMSDLRTYLDCKLMWDVYADVPTLINNFMENVYQQAAPYMTEYFNLLRSNMKAKEVEFNASGNDFHLDMYGSTPYQYSTQVYSKAFIETLMDLLDKAYASYSDIEDDIVREQKQQYITKESFCLRYVILCNYGQYYDINGPAYAEMVKQWQNDSVALGATLHREYTNIGVILEEFLSKIS